MQLAHKLLQIKLRRYSKKSNLDFEENLVGFNSQLSSKKQKNTRNS